MISVGSEATYLSVHVLMGVITAAWTVACCYWQPCYLLGSQTLFMAVRGVGNCSTETVETGSSPGSPLVM